MAKYDVTHSCGHTVEISLYGKHTERDRRLAYEAARKCAACHSASVAAARASESSKAAEAAKAADLPSLVGSPKQIAWAETIRAEKLHGLRELQVLVRDYPVPAPAATITALDTLATKLTTETSSRYWIEHRDCSARDLLRAQLETIAEIAPSMVAY